jgi:hypothetical protein
LDVFPKLPLRGNFKRLLVNEHIEDAQLKNNAIGCVPEIAAARQFQPTGIL